MDTGVVYRSFGDIGIGRAPYGLSYVQTNAVSGTRLGYGRYLAGRTIEHVSLQHG